MKSIFTAVILLASVALVSATVINVPADVATIQAGIDGASNGDTVLVASGTYVENLNYQTKNIVVLSSNGPAETTIDGNQNGSTVVIHSGQTNAAILEGFTITNGSGFLNPDGYYVGGGISVRNASSPSLKNLIISNNTAIGDTAMGGGIICAFGSDAIIENVIIRNNSADYGGGFFAYESDPSLFQVEVYGNLARTTGGGLAFWTSASIVEEVLVYDNSARYVAGGIWAHESATPTLKNITVVGNRCTAPLAISKTGGGLGISTGSSPTVLNSIFWDNSPNQIEFYSTTASNQITVNYSDIQNGYAGVETNNNGTVTWGQGNIDDNAFFCDVWNNLYTLAENSPCATAGDDGGVIGALGVVCALPLTLAEKQVVPEELVVYQNFPNPFNPTTTITYVLPSAGLVSVAVFDLLGNEVSTLVQGGNDAGYHSITWDARNNQGITLGAGVYLYRITFTDESGTTVQAVNKLSLLK